MSRFWETKPLSEMTEQEWESLCDGCGRCCLHRLEDEDTGEIFFTSIVCQYFDMQNQRCSCYSERTRLVPECLVVTLDNPESFAHAPQTCAYRLLAEGKPLFDWHPLIAGDNKKMIEAGVSILDKAISEKYVHPEEWQDHIIEWEKGGYNK